MNEAAGKAKPGAAGEPGGAAMLLQARNMGPADSTRMARFFAQFADDRLDGAAHSFASVAPGAFVLRVGPHDIARVSGVGADLSHCLARLGLGEMRHKLYLLPGERAELMAGIAEARANPVDAEAPSPVEVLARAETAIGTADLTELAHDTPAYMFGAGADRLVFDAVDVRLKDISTLIGSDVAANPWLAERVSTLVERRLLRDAAAATRRREAPLALHFHSRFAQAPVFWTLVEELPVRAKEMLILDFSCIDAAANPARLSDTLARLRKQGVATSLSDVSWDRLEAFEELAPQLAWIKGLATPAAAHALTKFGAERCVASDIGDGDAAEAALAAGFVVLAGAHVARFAQIRRAAAGRAPE